MENLRGTIIGKLGINNLPGFKILINHAPKYQGADRGITYRSARPLKRRRR